MRGYKIKTYRVDILRRQSQFKEWYKSSEIMLRASSIENVFKKVHKLESPYQMIGKIEEV